MGRKRKLEPVADPDDLPKGESQPENKGRTINNIGLPTEDEVKQIVSEIDDLIDQMGVDPGSVAKILGDNEISGQRNDDNRCPVANFLRKKCKKLPKSSYVSVQFDKILILDCMGGETLCSIPLSKGIERFIKDWDAGKYAKLEKKL